MDDTDTARADIEKTLRAERYKPFFDERREPGPRATKFMAERTDDGQRGITCVISHVDYWGYTLIWFPGTAEKRSSGQFDSTADLAAKLRAAWDYGLK